MSEHITLLIDNTGRETITLKDITLIWSVNFFDYSEIQHIGTNEGNLQPGNSFPFIVNFTGFDIRAMLLPGYES